MSTTTQPNLQFADALPGHSEGHAFIVGEYRYVLARRWEGSPHKVVNFIMLNPSKADSMIDDPTIRRCIGFAKSWGCGGLVVTNLFAFRATDPKRLRSAGDPVGSTNDDFILSRARYADLVVCAWGTHGTLFDRDKVVLSMLRAACVSPLLIGKPTKGGHPPHPLYLPGSAAPVPILGIDT